MRVSALATVPQRTASKKAPRRWGSSKPPGVISGRWLTGRTSRPGSTSHTTVSSSPRSSSLTLVKVARVRAGRLAGASSSGGWVLRERADTTHCWPLARTSWPTSSSAARPSALVNDTGETLTGAESFGSRSGEDRVAPDGTRAGIGVNRFHTSPHLAVEAGGRLPSRANDSQATWPTRVGADTQVQIAPIRLARGGSGSAWPKAIRPADHAAIAASRTSVTPPAPAAPRSSGRMTPRAIRMLRRRLTPFHDVFGHGRYRCPFARTNDTSG